MKKWQKWIKYRGIGWVADKLGLHYDTVRQWCLKGAPAPRDKHKLKLVKLSRGEIEILDFFR